MKKTIKKRFQKSLQKFEKSVTQYLQIQWKLRHFWDIVSNHQKFMGFKNRLRSFIFNPFEPDQKMEMWLIFNVFLFKKLFLRRFKKHFFGRNSSNKEANKMKSDHFERGKKNLLFVVERKKGKSFMEFHFLFFGSCKLQTNKRSDIWKLKVKNNFDKWRFFFLRE